MKWKGETSIANIVNVEAEIKLFGAHLSSPPPVCQHGLSACGGKNEKQTLEHK